MRLNNDLDDKINVYRTYIGFSLPLQPFSKRYTAEFQEKIINTVNNYCDFIQKNSKEYLENYNREEEDRFKINLEELEKEIHKNKKVIIDAVPIAKNNKDIEDMISLCLNLKVNLREYILKEYIPESKKVIDSLKKLINEMYNLIYQPAWLDLKSTPSVQTKRINPLLLLKYITLTTIFIFSIYFIHFIRHDNFKEYNNIGDDYFDNTQDDIIFV